jgi:predicted TIM-barrel fold metal-dependent hydrolase
MNPGAQAPSATALLEEAARLDARAREHKRAESFHRRQAQVARRSLAEIEAECRRLGIRFAIHHGHSPHGGTDR